MRMLSRGLMYVSLVVSAPAFASDPASFKPAAGFVPTAEVAIAIAIAVWVPIYGKEQIERERPFKARLIDGVWVVSGSLPAGYVGGVAEARISKIDGRVLGVIHGQ